MLIALNDITASDGKVMQVDASLETRILDFGFGRYPVRNSSPVSLRIQNRGNKRLLISGKAAVTLLIPCDRCLKEVPVSLHLRFEHEADMNETARDREEALDEQVFIDGYDLDVDRLVCSEILVNWPAKVLCREDCKGICPICGIDRNEENCSCSFSDLDPRMEKIQEIFKKFKEV